MNVILYIDNLATHITEEELKTLFIQVGEAIASGINKDRINQVPKNKDQRFRTTGILGQVDREIARFTTASFNDTTVRVRLKIPKEQHRVPGHSFEP